MIQDYEGEFSPMTGKKPNEIGKFELDVDYRPPNESFYWVEETKKVGFCISQVVDGYFDIAEFYIVPTHRGQKIGEKLAQAIFDKFQGSWQVRQLKQAEDATAFWRKVIAKYTHGNYVEILLEDPHWGSVICQRFKS